MASLSCLPKSSSSRSINLGLIQGLKLTAQAAERGSGGPCPVVTLDQAGFFLDVFQGFLRPNNNIPHPLPGDVIVLRDFRQGKIIVILQIIELFLPRREKIPIKS